MTVIEEKVACKVCGRSVTPERIEMDLKTCSRRCQIRYRRWKDPIRLRKGQLLAAAGGPEKVFWNDKALQAKLGTDRAGASRRLEALARNKGWEISWWHDGHVSCVAPVSPERRVKYLKTPEVRPR